MKMVYIGAVHLPITPEKLEIVTPGGNETLRLINDGEINVLHSPGLKTFTFDVILPSLQSYPFQNYTMNGKEAEAFTKYFEELQKQQLPFPFIVSEKPKNKSGRISISYFNTLCTIEEQSVLMDASNGQDHIISLSLKEYKEYGTYLCKEASRDSKGNVTYKATRRGTQSYTAALSKLTNSIATTIKNSKQTNTGWW